MQPLTVADILDKDAYEAARPDLRRRVMTVKGRRRVLVGEHCSMHFENRDTMHYQVQEMLRAENSWTREGAVEDELAAYNALVPGAGELTATLMLEYETREERADALPRLVGLERHLWLHVGDLPPIGGVFDEAQYDDGKVSAVQYVRFRLPDTHRAQMAADGT
ncbi:MAG: DUF3501 family protein, partial [Acidobacteria bacterium]|nr:DUF3501 family protein [Acidobacteriota bacterium]